MENEEKNTEHPVGEEEVVETPPVEEVVETDDGDTKEDDSCTGIVERTCTCGEEIKITENVPSVLCKCGIKHIR